MRWQRLLVVFLLQCSMPIQLLLSTSVRFVLLYRQSHVVLTSVRENVQASTAVFPEHANGSSSVALPEFFGPVSSRASVRVSHQVRSVSWQQISDWSADVNRFINTCYDLKNLSPTLTGKLTGTIWPTPFCSSQISGSVFLHKLQIDSLTFFWRKPEGMLLCSRSQLGNKSFSLWRREKNVVTSLVMSMFCD